MQGRLESQLKAEEKIKKLLSDMPKEVYDYYLNFSTNREFRSSLSYIQKLRRFLVWYNENSYIKVPLNETDLSLITDYDIALYLKLVEKKQNGNGEIEYTSFSYRKQIWSILNSFFSFLDKKNYIKENPVRLIERPTKKDKVSHVFLSEDDINSLIDTVNTGVGNKIALQKQEKWRTRDLAIVYMFSLTGMRESALCEIDLNKIDLENNSLEVIDKEHKHNTYNIVPKLKEVLLDWLEVREKLLAGEDCNALFISNQRKRINPATVRVIINKYSESTFGYKVSPHRLRAAYGNIIYKETHDIELTSRAMKHANIATTRIYMEDDEQEVNNRVADILGDKF